LWLVGVFIIRRFIRGADSWNKVTKDLHGKVVLITGANTGIGFETAKELAKMGGHIVIACRDINKGNIAKKVVQEYSKNEFITVVELDLSSFESIVQFVKKLHDMNLKIDILINNAGVMMCPFSKTKDGLEMQVGTNHIGHFYLTLLMIDQDLINEKEGRILNVSSNAHQLLGQDLDPEKLFFDEKNYNKYKAYGHSKLANVLFTIELQRRLVNNNIKIITVSLHPGGVSTEITRHTISDKFQWFSSLFFKTPLQGAQTSLYCSLSDDVTPGAYYEDCKLKKATIPKGKPNLAFDLWETSEKVINYQSKKLKNK